MQPHAGPDLPDPTSETGLECEYWDQDWDSVAENADFWI